MESGGAAVPGDDPVITPAVYTNDPVCQDNYALRSLQPLLDVTATSGGRFRVVTRQLQQSGGEGYRPVLKQVSYIVRFLH